MMDQQLLARVRDWVTAHEDEMMRELAALVAFPSVSRPTEGKPGAPFGADCAQVLAHALSRAEAMGFCAENVDGYCGVAKMGPEEPAIGIAAHLDVVPVQDGWLHPPFELTREGDYVFGRGCQDNKASAVKGLFVMRCLRELGVPLRCGVRTIFGTSEENGMADLRYFAANGNPPTLTLVSDSDYPVCYGQKGHFNATLSGPAGSVVADAMGGTVPNIVPGEAWLRLRGMDAAAVSAALPEDAREAVTAEQDGADTIVRARGLSSHAAYPKGGINAIRLLLNAVLAAGLPLGDSEPTLRALQGTLRDDAGGAFDLAMTDAVFGELTMIGSVLRLGKGRLSLGFDSRFPGCIEGPEMIVRVRKYADANGLEMTDETFRNAFYIDPEDPKVQKMMSIYREMTGDAREAYVMGGGTYSHVLPRAVTFGGGIPGANDAIKATLPAGHGGAHQPDEALHVPSFLQSVVIYAMTIAELDGMV